MEKQREKTVANDLETIQCLLFKMADEIVVIDGARVWEILELSSLKNEMQLPDFMQGVINLCGCQVPIVDLQLKLIVQKSIQTGNSFNILAELTNNGQNVILQPLAHGIQEASEMEPSQVKAAPHWLRCRFSSNDFKTLSDIFLNAGPKAAKPEGDVPWPL
jgi:purine-binding chemotaxis protein CheW